MIAGGEHANLAPSHTSAKAEEAPGQRCAAYLARSAPTGLVADAEADPRC